MKPPNYVNAQLLKENIKLKSSSGYLSFVIFHLTCNSLIEVSVNEEMLVKGNKM